MEPIPTKEKLPKGCVDDGDYEVWWFNAEECSWHLGLAIFMDFEDENTFEKWTHWLPEDSISNPGD